MRYIANVSFGKDSLAMLLMLIEKEEPLDEVIFYDTGMEFNAIYDTRDKVIPLLKNKKIMFTELKPERPFLYDMLLKPVCSKKNGDHKGYGWCGGRTRWGTFYKQNVLNNYKKKYGDCIYYIGIAHDEYDRIEKEHRQDVRLPLVEWKVCEGEALVYCYKHGYWWEENGKHLYAYLDRVSCWCCSNKNLKELRYYHDYMPEYWNKLKFLQSRIEKPMKGPNKSIFDLEKRWRKDYDNSFK